MQGCLKILMIDDNSGDIRYVQELLVDYKSSCIEFYHVSTLLESIKFIAIHKIDIILLEPDLPDSRGLGTLREIYTAAIEIPIIIVSGIMDEKLGIEMIRFGAQDYLEKNQLSSRELIQSIEFAIERSAVQMVQQKKLIIQYKVIKILSESANLSTAGNNILKNCVEIFQLQAGKIFAMDAMTHSLSEVSAWQADLNYQLENEKKALYHIVSTKDFYISPTLFGAPIMFENKLLGVILFWGENNFTEDKLKDSLRSITNQLVTFIKHKRLEGDLLYFSQHDWLTKISNRTSFESQLNQAIAVAEWEHSLLAVIYLDLDNFKDINDQWGHDKGDIVLVEVANRLHYLIRKKDVASRFAGDEFVIMLNEIKKREEAFSVANKLLDSLRAPIKINNHEINLSASIGISIYPNDGNSVHELVKNADMAMYSAKRKGKSKIIFSKNIHDMIQEKESMERQILNAIKEHNFLFYYQPIVNLNTNQICGYEALLRWKKNDEIILPDEFFPLMEQGRVQLLLNKWVIRHACRKIKMHPNIFKHSLSVNVSVEQLYDNFIDNLQHELNRNQIDPNKIIIEVTETTLIKKIEDAIYILQALKEMGIKVSLDDFGTGYSSLSYIKYFPVSSIKIDRSFISGLPDNPESIAIVNAIIGMAHALNLEVIAEGVETKEQLNYLREKQCDKYQGFLFSKPIPIEELIKII